MVNNLNGKVAIITGSSRGIGKVISKQLAGLGTKVVINYSSSSDKAEDVVKEIKENGGEAISLRADMSKIGDIQSLFKETLNAFGKIDILINNAGIMINKPLQDATEEDFDKQFAINAKGTFFACQQAMKYMEDEGRIVNISTSVNGMMFPAYVSTQERKGQWNNSRDNWQKNSALKRLLLMLLPLDLLTLNYSI